MRADKKLSTTALCQQQPLADLLQARWADPNSRCWRACCRCSTACSNRAPGSAARPPVHGALRWIRRRQRSGADHRCDGAALGFGSSRDCSWCSFKPSPRQHVPSASATAGRSGGREGVVMSWRWFQPIAALLGVVTVVGKAATLAQRAVPAWSSMAGCPWSWFRTNSCSGTRHRH